MATYEITSPDGQIYEVTAPDNASEAAVLAYAKTQFAKQDIEKQSEQPKTAIQKLNELSAPIGRAGKELYESLGHNIQKPFHNIANIAQQGMAGLALAAAPDSKFAQSLGKQAMEDEEATKRWEAEYQARVPDSPASYTGASIGSLLPFMASGAQQGMQALGHAGGQIAKGGLFSKVGSATAQGAVGAGLTAPSLEDVPRSALAGGLLGGGIAGIAAPLISGATKGAGYLYDAAKGNLPKIKAGEIMRDSAGDDLLAIQKKMIDAPKGETAAQAAYGIDNDVWQALGELAKKHDKKAVYRLMQDKQLMQETNQLAKFARGSTAEESATSREWMRKRLEMALRPIREGELKKAGFAGQVIPEAERRIALAEGGRAINPNTGKPYTHPATGEPVYTGRAGAMHEAGKLYAEFGNQANQAWKTAERKLGKIGDIKIARNTEQGIKSYEAAQEFVDIAKGLSNEIKANQKIISAVESSGLKPLDVRPITNRIDLMLKSKVTQVNDTEVKVLGALKNKLNVVSKDGVDPFALYELRKNGLNEIVDNLQDSGQLSKEAAKRSLLKLRPMIDKAIEDAGATQWGSGYLNKYSKGFEAIDRVNVMDKLRDLYESNPKQFIDVVSGKDPDFIKKLIPNKDGITGLFSDSRMKQLQSLASKADRRIKMAERASGASTALGDVVSKDSWRFRFPGLISAKISTANKVLDEAEKVVGRKTMDELVKGMQSGKNANELLNMLPISNRSHIMKKIVESGKLAKYSGVIGSQQGQEK